MFMYFQNIVLVILVRTDKSDFSRNNHFYTNSYKPELECNQWKHWQPNLNRINEPAIILLGQYHLISVFPQAILFPVQSGNAIKSPLWGAVSLFKWDIKKFIVQTNERSLK